MLQRWLRISGQVAYPQQSVEKSPAFCNVEKLQNGNVDAINIEISKAIHLTG
jgi:hypothetical protein